MPVEKRANEWSILRTVYYGTPVEPADLEFAKTRSVQVVEVPREELPRRAADPTPNEGAGAGT